MYFYCTRTSEINYKKETYNVCLQINSTSTTYCLIITSAIVTLHIQNSTYITKTKFIFINIYTSSSKKSSINFTT